MFVGALALAAVGLADVITKGSVAGPVALIVGLAFAFRHLQRRRLLNGRALARLHRELARLVNTHGDGQRLVVTNDHDDRVIFLECSKNKVLRGFFRMYSTDIEPSRVDQPGYRSGEMFYLIWFDNRVRLQPTGALMDENGHVVPPPATDTHRKRSVVELRKDRKFRERTGQGFATVEQLQELIHQIHQAEEFVA